MKRSVPAGHAARGIATLLLSVASVAAGAWAIYFPLGFGSAWWNPHVKPVTLCFAFLLLCLLFAAAVWVCARAFDLGRLLRPDDARAPRVAIAAGAVLILLSLASAILVQQQFAGSGDEFAYLFEAKTFLAGRLWNAPPAGGQAMAPMYIWVTPTRWVAQYPPGWPGVLALWSLVGLNPWALGAALAGATALILYRMTAAPVGRVSAMLAVVLFAAAPFSTFNAGSLFSHTLAATLACASAWAAARRRDGGGLGWAVAVGGAVGLLGLTRSLTAVLVLAPLAAAMLRRRDWKGVVAVGLAGIPFAAALLWYQWQITGAPLKSVYWIGGRDVDHLYLSRAELMRGSLESIRRLLHLGLWTSPVMLALWPLACWVKVKASRFEAADAVAPLLVGTFLLYPINAGNGFGPRYYFDVFPLMVFTISTARPILSAPLRRTVDAAIIISALAGFALLPALGWSYHRIMEERRDVFDQVAAVELRDAAVCIRGSTGVTLDMQPMDLARNDPAGVARVLYARCDLTTADALERAYPERSIWTYNRDADAVHGRLERWR